MYRIPIRNIIEYGQHEKTETGLCEAEYVCECICKLWPTMVGIMLIRILKIWNIFKIVSELLSGISGAPSLGITGFSIVNC